MMSKDKIEKNRLDLAYRKQLQILNITLLLGTISLISLISSFIWFPERWVIGSALTIVIGILAINWYKKIDKTLKNISNKIKNL